MKPVDFPREERDAATAKLRAYFRDELDQDLGRLQADLLLDFIGQEIGGFFYNRGLYDAQAVVKRKAEDIVEAIYGLERGEG